MTATLSFAGFRTLINYVAPDDMPVYSVEKLTRVESIEDDSPNVNITIEKEEAVYIPKLFSDREPTNKIVEYGAWEEKDDHFERKVDIYKTDMKKKAIKEILKSELSTEEFMNKKSTITETSNIEPSKKEIVHKEAYFYKYLKDRELTEEEQEKLDSINNKISLFAASLFTLLWLYAMPKNEKETNKEKVKK